MVVMVMVMVKVMVQLSVMNARRLIKPRLVCECILVVWSAIYLGIAIRFWILLSGSLPLPCFA